MPNKVETAPVVYLYNSTSTARLPPPTIEKCVTQPQRPEGKFVVFGTPLSVAKVANNVLVLPAIVAVTVCSAALVAVGDHSLYVGVPKAVSVLFDWLR